jgi:hypothetical protein
LLQVTAMPHYFVIDRDRTLSRIEAKDKACAHEDYNYLHEVRADLVLEAAPCKHGRYAHPELPDWFEYNTTAASKLCHTCSNKADTQTTVPQTTLFFEHSKTATI